jgi:Acyltransferase family
VLVTHVAYLSSFHTRSPLGAFTARMDVGVAVFFLISGFLLYRPFVAARYDEGPSESIGAYFWRRALRIFPVYWLALTVTIFVLHVPSDIPSAKDLLLYYSLTHLYSLENVFGPILSSYTLVTEVAFHVFLPLFVFALSRVRGPAERRMHFDLIALAPLFVLGVAYRTTVASGSSGLASKGQLENILPGLDRRVRRRHGAGRVQRVALAPRRRATEVGEVARVPRHELAHLRDALPGTRPVDRASARRVALATRSGKTWESTTSTWPWGSSSCSAASSPRRRRAEYDGRCTSPRCSGWG